MTPQRRHYDWLGELSMHIAELQQKIEFLRGQMVEKFLRSGSYQSEEVIDASQELDRVLNCYDCLRYNRNCPYKAKCEIGERK